MGNRKSDLQCSTSEPQRLTFTNMTTLIWKHDVIDIADPSSIQDACHMSLLLILASRGRLTLSNTVPLSRTLLKPSFKSWIPWEKKVWLSRTTDKGWFREVIQPLVQTGTSNRSSCITRAEHVCNHVRGQIADANFWSSVKKLLMSWLNLAWKFDVSVEARAKQSSKGQNILCCWDWKRPLHDPILLKK